MHVDIPGQDQTLVVSEEELQQGKLLPEHFQSAALLLHTQGYVVLKGAVPSAVAAQASQEFNRLYHDCLASKNGDSWYQTARESGAIFWERNCRWRIFPRLQPPLDSPWILANPFALDLLRFLLGEGFFCKFVSSDTCTKGAKLQLPHRELGAGQSWEPVGYIVNVPLVACGLHNGPLEIWPGGSHLWSNELLGRLQLNTDVQDGQNPDCEHFAAHLPSRRVVLEVGDLLIRDPGLLHRGTVNHTDEPRTMLTVCYFRRGHTHDYGQLEYNLDRTAWQRLDPSIQPLFAHAFARETKRAGSLRRWFWPWSKRRSA